MAFIIEGYNTEKKHNENITQDEELIELDAFEECLKQKQKKDEFQKDLETVRRQKEQLAKELSEYEQLRNKVEETKSRSIRREQDASAVTEKQMATDTTSSTKADEERIEQELQRQTNNTRKSVETFGTNTNTSMYNRDTSEAKETASDFIEATLDVFENFGGTVQRFSGITSKIKQVAHTAWSLKQDREIKRKFRDAPKVNVGDYTFRVLMNKKELMLYSYQGPNTILKLPSMVKDMPITAINSDFLLFRTPKALLNTIKGETIGRDLDSIKQCMTCVQQLRLPEQLTYLPSNLFENCSTLDVVVIPRAVIGVSSMFLEGSNVKHVVFEGKCPAGLKHATIPSYTRISCRKEYRNSYNGITNLSTI